MLRVEPANHRLSIWFQDGTILADGSFLDYAVTAEAARRVFRERAMHAFPPSFVMPPEWRPELEALTLDLGFPVATSADIEQRFLEIIRRLEHSAKPDRPA